MSENEDMRDELHLSAQEAEKLKTLRQALTEGEQSGFVENFDPQEFKNILKYGLADNL